MLVDGPKLKVQDEKGEPAPDPHDGVMYVITEVAQYSLKDPHAATKGNAPRTCAESDRHVLFGEREG